MAKKKHNELNTSTFLSMMRGAGFKMTDEAARYLLRNHSNLGEIREPEGSRYKQYIYWRDQVEELILLKSNKHKEYYSLIELCKETNYKRHKYSIWRQKFQHILLYQLHIHPVKKYGRVYVTRDEAKRVKKAINPITKNRR